MPGSKTGERFASTLPAKGGTRHARSLDSILPGSIVRWSTQDAELDRVLGGGIVPGSISLIGGQPGIGKSTLLLQVALNWKGKVLYISGEESAEQIKMRADRVNQQKSQTFILAETHLEAVIKEVGLVEPDLIIVDSIQTVYTSSLDSAPGTVSQVRDCTSMLQRLAKEQNVPVIVIGHITKEGSLAGPKILEHVVDTVLQFEGDRHHSFRILRTLKNRFGSTDEIGIYEMMQHGMIPVENPFKIFVQEKNNLSGSAVAATLEGQRPMLIEVQALVGNAVYGTPQRSTTGFDLRRLHMLLAVLEKRCGLFFGQMDVFLNIAGGLRVTDPATDLAVIAALVSSLEDLTMPPQTCFAGEVGLSGEIRSVQRLEQRIAEADRLGFEQIFVSESQPTALELGTKGIKINQVGHIQELYDQLFG